MALIREQTIPIYGITAGYWKVGMFTIDTNMKEVSFSLNLYINKEIAKEPNTFINTYCVSDLMGLEDKTLYNKYFAKDKGNTYKDWQTACYMYAKENVEFFMDAVDDEDEVALLRD